MDQQLVFYLGEDTDVRKLSISTHVPRVNMITLEEATYLLLRTLSLMLAGVYNRSRHLIATYDVQKLKPVAWGNGISVSRNSIDQAKLVQ